MRFNLSIAATAALAACAYHQPRGGPPIPLVNAAGQSIGTVSAWQSQDGLALKIKASGSPPGLHGIHVHAVGRCEGPDFKSAGPHWSPAARKHGLSNPAGPHGGDLPNITATAEGRLDTIVTVAGASLSADSLADADGASLVIHAKADDNMTDPSGNSGERIACAILVPSRPGA
jgi:Cu-Zn family superoxide dismutase